MARSKREAAIVAKLRKLFDYSPPVDAAGAYSAGLREEVLTDLETALEVFELMAGRLERNPQFDKAIELKTSCPSLSWRDVVERVFRVTGPAKAKAVEIEIRRYAKKNKLEISAKTE